MDSQQVELLEFHRNHLEELRKSFPSAVSSFIMAAERVEQVLGRELNIFERILALNFYSSGMEQGFDESSLIIKGPEPDWTEMLDNSDFPEDESEE